MADGESEERGEKACHQSVFIYLLIIVYIYDI